MANTMHQEQPIGGQRCHSREICHSSRRLFRLLLWHRLYEEGAYARLQPDDFTHIVALAVLTAHCGDSESLRIMKLFTRPDRSHGWGRVEDEDFER